jgi:hypothetical protein
MNSFFEKSLKNLKAFASSIARSVLNFFFAFDNVYTFRAYDKNGNLLWEDVIHNTVCDLGITDVWEQYFNGANYTAGHYITLISVTPTVATGDDMTTHAGWTEVVAYDEATRPQLVWDSASNKEIDNSSSPARFTISTNNTTFGGAVITTSDQKSGTAGILFGGGAFSNGNKQLSDGDYVDVTVTITGANA